MGLDWNQLVEERNVWVAHNFPDPDGSRTPLDSVLGCMEEMGELTHAHLKQVQAIRGTPEEHEANAKDSIGDLAVYLLGVISFVGKVKNLTNKSPKQPDADDALLKLGWAVGQLANSMFDVRPRPGNTSYIAYLANNIPYIIMFSHDYCTARGWDYDQIVTDTWNSVKQRDWQRYPFDGLTK